MDILKEKLAALFKTYLYDKLSGREYRRILVKDIVCACLSAGTALPNDELVKRAVSLADRIIGELNEK